MMAQGAHGRACAGEQGRSMRAHWQDEVALLLRGGNFERWHASLEVARDAVAQAKARVEDELDAVAVSAKRVERGEGRAEDALSDADTFGHAAALCADRVEVLDNAALDMVSHFENQRTRCTRLWESLGALEMAMDTAKEAGRTAEVAKLEHQHALRLEAYEIENAQKHRMWREVESLWGRALLQNLEKSELSHRADRTRENANTLFAAQGTLEAAHGEAQAALRQAQGALAEAERAFEAALDSAGPDLGAVARADYLYWPAAEDNNMVYVTPLRTGAIEDLTLMPGTLYQCDHRHGLAGMTPVQPA